MFSSVKERALQIANGQYQSLNAPTTPTREQAAPPSGNGSKTAPSKTVTAKFTPSKSSKSSSSKPTPKSVPSPSTPSKAESPRTSSTKTSSKTSTQKSSAKESLPKASTDAKVSAEVAKTSSTKSQSPTSKSASSKSSSKSSSSQTSSKTSSKTPSPKKSSSKTPKTSSSKTSTAKPSSAGTTSHNAPSPTVRSRISKVLPEFSIGSFAEDLTEESTKLSDLKAACLKQASGVTGGRPLALVLKQRSSSGQWYAALKDTSSDRYLTLWTNRDKTFPTQIEALEAYLVFAKRMKLNSRLFPFSMSPKTSKSKQ